MWRRILSGVLALSIIVAFVGASYLLGWYATEGGERPEGICLGPTTQSAAEYQLESAWHLESLGRLDDAAAIYVSIIDMKIACLATVAVGRLDRISAVRDDLGFAYPAISDIANISARTRGPVIAITILFAMGWVIVRIAPRRGTQIANFPVYGSQDDAASRAFREALIWFAAEIRRVYGSEYARALGMTLLFDDLQGLELDRESDRGLAELTDADTKSALRFALVRIWRLVGQASKRPVLLLAGDVRLLPDGAKAVATLRNLRTGKELRIEAHTREVDDLPVAWFVQRQLLAEPMNPPNPPVFRRAEDQRQTAAWLYSLALLVACKVRFAQLQTIDAGYKPSSWKTVCLLTAAAVATE